MLNKLAKLREERTEDDDKGFTLIELLVVVVIIGVLVAIAIPLYLNYKKGAENKAAQADVRNAVTAVEACITDNGTKAPGTASTAVSADGTKVINLTCVSAGTGTAAAAASKAGDQTINVSDGVTVTYTPNATNTGYTVKGVSANGKSFTYDSSTGKTT